ncbi:MAG TPA: hypothetical protein VK432_05770 [Stellaceae bacterium]|nr:hypothetical protein [Stellaceae bacterium]
MTEEKNSAAFRSPFSGTSEQIKSQISQLAKITPWKKIDDDAIEAGKRIRNGEFTKSNLKVIYEWKNGDSRFYKSKLEPMFDSNSPQEIESVLKTVNTADTSVAAINALSRLKGIKIPTASAILAHLYPERFTVTDIRALNALGVRDIEVAFYLLYNQFCLDLAKNYGVSVRDLDRALWQLGGKRSRRRNAINLA